MVKAAALVLLAWVPWALAAPGYQVDKRQLALGEALTLTLAAPAGKLETLDTAPLAADFEIQSRTLNRGGRTESLVLTLYPLHTGRLTLPALGLPYRPPVVRVNAQSDTVPKVRFAVATDPARPLTRQPTRLIVEACDDGSLEWKRPVLPTLEALYLRPLGEQQVEVEREGERCTAHRWYWAIIPTTPGSTNLPLPVLEAGKFGQRLRFPPPPAGLDVRPLPAWLPAAVAVGRPVASSSPLPRSWPMERPLAWRIEIDGGYPPAALKALLEMQLVGHPGMSAYPPVVEALPFEASLPNFRLAATLYVLPGQAGPLQLPDIVLPWADPADGALHGLLLPGPRLEVIDTRYGMLRGAGLMLLAAIASAAGGWRLLRVLRWRRARRCGLAAIAGSANAAALAQRVRAFSLQPGQAAAPSLGVWQDRMAAEAHCAGVDALVTTLGQVCYGRSAIPLGELRARALEVLNNARPRRGAGLHRASLVQSYLRY